MDQNLVTWEDMLASGHRLVFIDLFVYFFIALPCIFCMFCQSFVLLAGDAMVNVSETAGYDGPRL